MNDERAAIVAYLRATAKLFSDRAKRGDRPLVSNHHADALTFAADAIAVGAHIGLLPIISGLAPDLDALSIPLL